MPSWRWVLAIVAVAWLDYKAVMEAIIHLHYLRPPQWVSSLNEPGNIAGDASVDSSYLQSKSGNIIGVWSLAKPDSAVTILYIHGQLGTRGQWRRRKVLSYLYTSLSASVVTYDPSGYADSTGWPSAANLKRDVESVIEWIKRDSRLGQKIVIWGHSLGGPMAAHAASLGLGDGLILEATFSLLSEPAVSGLIGSPLWIIPEPARTWLVGSILDFTISGELDTAKYLGRVSVPVFLLHGGEDLIVPVKSLEKLREAARSSVSELVIPEAGHNNLYVSHFVDGYPEVVTPVLLAWLAEL